MDALEADMLLQELLEGFEETALVLRAELFESVRKVDIEDCGVRDMVFGL